MAPENSTSDNVNQTQYSAPANLGTTSNDGNSNDNDASDMGADLYYIIAAGVPAGTVWLIVAVVVVVAILWKRKSRRSSVTDIEADREKGEGIYVEIAETSNKKRKTTPKGKRKKAEADNNNEGQGIELMPMDTAPDIITAHDSESIYETLDGRRAARSRAANVTSQDNQPSDSNVTTPGKSCNTATSSVLDTTYDHLNRFRDPTLPQNSPGKRNTDPALATQPKCQATPRAVHSTGGLPSAARLRRESAGQEGLETCGTCALATRRESAPENARSALAELARRSSWEGKRIVCQLTMVGMVENGKPVPLQRPPAAGNAYFLLEPGRTSQEVDEKVLQQSVAPNASFRIRSEIPGDGVGTTAGGTKSEYFTLEPLDQQEDLAELPPHVKDKLETSSGLRYNGSRCSLPFNALRSSHGQEDCGQSVGSTCKRSYPSPSPPEEGLMTSPTLPPRNLGYGRSMSSPQSSQYKRSRSVDLSGEGYKRSFSSPHSCNYKETRDELKMDAELLNARIQHEMRALGFISDTDSNDQPHETTDAEAESGPASERQLRHRSEVPRPETRPPRNDYFILEPEAGGDDKDENASVPCCQPEPYPVRVTEGDTGGRPRYQRQAPQPLPPRPPQRNPGAARGHIRSKSETPLLKRSHTRETHEKKKEVEEEEEQGPVVVSLKKCKSVDSDKVEESGIPSRDSERRESFRPRFKSECGILSRPAKKK